MFTVQGATRYTSQAVLDSETRLLDAAKTPTTESIPAHLVDVAIAEIEHADGLRLDAEQCAIARYLCTNPMLLSVAVGPAGSGKTTAMKPVCAAWHTAGRNVIALAPSATAARQLGADLGIRAHTIATLLTRAGYGRHTGLTPGAMILIDEAAMASTADLDAVLALAQQHGAIVRCVGDPEQLSAVEAGGIIRTLARDTRAPHLHRLIRFADPDEAAATLAVRAGKLEQAWEFYNGNGRVTHGMNDQLRQAILDAHLADTAAGISSLMIAATLDNVAALNAAAQAAHAAGGRVDATGPRIRLSDKHSGYLGDTIVTRLNNPALRVTGGIRDGTGIDNGDLWRIHTIHPDGSLTALGLGHRGTVRLPGDYITEHVELGYATSIHRAQGSTVDHAYLLMDATFGRALAYVGLTRARLLNRIYLATDRLLDITGDQQPDDPTNPKVMFARVLAREDDNLSATDVMRAEQDAADHRTRTAYTEAYQLLADARGTYLLNRALPTMLFHDANQSDQFQTLLDTLALAETHGLDTGELVAVIATNNYQDLGESLAEARDTAAVLRARADRWISTHLPVPPPATATVQTDVLPRLTAAQAETMATNLNIVETLSLSPKRFRVLRDAPYRGPCRSIPSPHPGRDTQLAAYATELRHRILPPTADAVLQPDSTAAQNISATLSPRSAIATIRSETLTTLDPQASITFIAHLNRAEILHETTSDAPPITADDLDLAQFGIHERKQRIERWRADYHHYIRQLAEHHADHLLYRALPVVIHHQAQRSFHYDQLLATIALAHAHGLDIVTLVTDVATNNHHDLGASLLLAHDPAAELRARADAWIYTHATDLCGAHLNRQETLPTAEANDLAHAIAQLNVPTEVLHPNLILEFRALKHLPYSGRFRPIPNYPGRDEALARYAADLRDRIEHEQKKLADLTRENRADPMRRTAPEPISQPTDLHDPPVTRSRTATRSLRRSEFKRPRPTSRRTRRPL